MSMAENEPDQASGARSGGRCPVCGRARDPNFKPFCSRTCRDRDLINWLDGRYAVPAVETDEDPEGDRERRDDQS
jgi:endogenous inhibitor of DNA gyrase (YacG/DUF329 family)